jgi:ribokinase
MTTIVRAGRLPSPGDICTTRPVREGPAGGGAVAAVRIAALVGSGCDPAEQYRPIAVPPRLLVRTGGVRGGAYLLSYGTAGRYPAVPASGPPVDTYGIGDNFAASLTVALAAGCDPETALRSAAADGAACSATRGPYPLRGLRPAPIS